MTTYFGILALFMALSLRSISSNIYLVDDVEGFGQPFDGIGGISGGGATSKLLINYPEKQRSEILDYLFKPNFGASLQIFKVEIGGDAQSTDGTESSHMHNEDEINFERGYEWFLMKEAKKRNPKIKLGALAWAFPGWVGEIPREPYANFTKLAYYLTTWLKGAKDRYDLDIDYIGIWNEQKCDKEFVKYFRKYLNQNNLSSIKLIAPDSYDLEWSVTKQMHKDEEFHNAIDIIGEHYPGTYSTQDAVNTGKILWSSEDYSTLNDRIGAGCWARILNQNYVRGYMSATLSWNLIYSYYDGLPYGGCGLMTANEPWSGHYTVSLPIWVTAHTTHFSEPGWYYLKHNRGVGLLDGGGSFVSLAPSNKTQLTIIIETLTYGNSKCIRPELKPYAVADHQVVQFMLGGTFKNIRKLYVWRTDLSPKVPESERQVLDPQNVIEVQGGIVSINILADNLYTLTTIFRESPVVYKPVPLPFPFPTPYFDDFEDYVEFAEPYNLSPQVGVFEARKIGVNGVMAQVVQQTPIHWCIGNKYAMPSPTVVIGDYKWSNVEVSVDVLWPSYTGPAGMGTGYLAPEDVVPIYLAARVNKGGCETHKSNGIFFWIHPSKKLYRVTNDLRGKNKLFEGNILGFDPYNWHKITLIVKGNHAMGYVDKILTFSGNFSNVKSSHGFVALGTMNYSPAFFDNLNISSANCESIGSTSYLSYFRVK
ncbi:unnamed protein product [Gordionus sp. m RMFG-2023]